MKEEHTEIIDYGDLVSGNMHLLKLKKIKEKKHIKSTMMFFISFNFTGKIREFILSYLSFLESPDTKSLSLMRENKKKLKLKTLKRIFYLIKSINGN